MAVWIREAKRMGWTPIAIRESNDIEQINEKLFKLQALEAKAWAEGDDAKVAQRIADSFPWIRLKMQMTILLANRMGPAIDIDDSTSRRLAEARERREKAVGEEEKK